MAVVVSPRPLRSQPERPGVRAENGAVAGSHRCGRSTFSTPTTPLVLTRAVRPVEERLWARVDRSAANACWVWSGAMTHGYGSIQNGPGRTKAAHRIAYEALVGPIPAGLTLDHLCRNRACVNPAHLEPVTAAENKRRGESVPAQKARQTYCKSGHPLDWITTDRTYVNPKGERHCRACRREYERGRRVGLTPTTPVQLTRYRQGHRIVSGRDFEEDTGRMVDVCSHDGIRLYAQRGRWIHDPSTIRSLAALERGEGIAW